MTGADTAPVEADPDDPRKPQSPTELTKSSWLYVLRSTARQFSRDQCTDLAAALTYYAVLSLVFRRSWQWFPFSEYSAKVSRPWMRFCKLSATSVHPRQWIP